ncbi:bile acid:sodium symporter [Micrococcus sp.]|uniref:bile acid:sodium symporter n=1 Tax=Micrococcus sp. TaxID=1271 RepID=UPI0026DC8139|nr:bile acid:sodium symporter [Micrococcus sp.]MDO4239842.1 bile acid:sodium symporter [Micrococcus sp.]
MLELFQTVGQILVTVFVLTSMANVGLTQKPSRILAHLRNWHFLLAMVLVNLVVTPALMLLALQLVDVEPHYATGLLVMGLAAGAPFLIKLTQTSESDLALGATVLMVLMVATVLLMPVMLPLLMPGVEVEVWPMVQALLVQMALPLAVGMLFAQVAQKAAGAIQPWIARVSNIALYGLIVATLIGYSPALLDAQLWLALAVGLVVLVVAFTVGYMMGDGHDHLKDVGGLGTAQRGTAAALIVATTAFDDPRVLVVIVILNTLGVVLLIAAARWMASDGGIQWLSPAGPDMPTRALEGERS